MKRIITLALVICTALLMTACGEKEPESPATSEKGFEPTLDTNTDCSITVVGNYDNFEALEAEFDRFNKIYPNVKLSYMKLDDYNDILATTLDGEDKPNIFFSYAWMIGNKVYDSVFAHMEKLSDPSLGLNLDFIRPGLINRDDNGAVMMVPVFSRSYGMLVNDDLFKKEGLSVPTTWTELLDVCKAFKSKGYDSPMMGYSLETSGCFMTTLAYPRFVATLAENPKALELANKLDPAAGEYMRPALETVESVIQNGCIDIKECDKISDNYAEVILRFFEGDVPMMICTADTVSGTKKRESQSEAFTKSPFNYTFAPIPTTDEGGYFIDSPSVEFSVNKDCDNLDMTNEFMRFLITENELNEMASVKGLITPTANMSFDSVYAPFGNVPSERTLSPEALGITDPLTIQIKGAAFQVGKGEKTVDDVVKLYGTYE